MILKNNPDWLAYRDAVRAHIVATLNGGVSRAEMAGVLGVGRAAICSYVKGRTIPKPHLIEKLLTRWPTKLPFRDEGFGAGAYGGKTPDEQPVGIQGSLFESLMAIKPEDLKVEVDRVTPEGLWL